MNGIVDEKELKKLAKQFSLESIYTLTLTDRMIHDLGCLGSCLNLTHLDLSSNKIVNLSVLRSLKKLEVFLASNNRIASLAGLDGLESLSVLHVAGNFISNVSSLLPLQNLEKLRTLNLKDASGNITNPLYGSNPNTRAHILELLPQLSMLDWEYLAGPGNEVTLLCTIVDEQLSIAQLELEKMKDFCSCLPSSSWPDYVLDETEDDDPDNVHAKVLRAVEECQLLQGQALELISHANNCTEDSL